MKCPRCQAENDAGARFCEDCGAGLEAVCPTCSTPVTLGKKFCRSCGAALTTAPAGRFPSPESYTPKHLADRILTSRVALEGERKHVTVLFADLKGSMELLADRDPEDARKILDPVIEHMMEAVHRYEGTVNQVMGDGIMALFGAPLAHEDHAVRACYAAMRMQESVKRYAEGLRKTEGFTVRIRVGLNSGNVVVRAIGNDLHMDYTAVGQTTHLAARMEQIADPGSILITAETWNLVEGFIAVKALGDVPVKGLTGRFNVYEVVGAEAAGSRLHVAAGRGGLTRFIGRDPETERLRLALRRARAGNGQLVAVVGEPGIGKSRLYWEFIRSQAVEGCLVLQSRSVSYGKATSYLPVIDLLKAYFQIETRDDRRRVREKITGKFLGLDEAMRPSLPAVLALLDASGEDATWQALDATQRRQRTLDAVRHLVLRESREQPLIVVFEDLHWIDSETQALLDLLVENVPSASLLVLVNYRPEYHHRWGNKTYYQQLQIAPLPSEDASSLLEDLVGSDPALRSLKDLLIARTAGNPFFLEESIRILIESGALVGDRGAYHLANAPSSIQIPPTVQAVLAARIDRLDGEAKHVLQCAAVIGKDVPLVLLEAIAGLEEEDLRRQLSTLQAAEFVYEARLFPDSEYTFKHALTQEVAYTELTNARRRALDGAVVDAIERLFSERLSEHVERLASHAFRGEVWDKAAMYLQKAGEKAAARAAYRQVVADLERALVALGHFPEERSTLERFVDVKLALRSVTMILGDLDAAFGHANDALAASERMQDSVRTGLSCAAVTFTLGIMGRAVEAVPLAQRGVTAAALTNERRAALGAMAALGQTHLLLGDYREGRRCFEANLDTIRSESVDLASLPLAFWAFAANSRAWLAFILADLGDFEEALRNAREASQLADARKLFYPLATFAGQWTRVQRGDVTNAVPELERSLGLCREMNNVVMSVPFAAALGRAYTLEGRSAEAVATLNEAIALAEIHNRANRSLFLSFLSEAYLEAGQRDEAMRVADVGLRGARERKERAEEAWCLRALGEALQSGEHPDMDAAGSSYRNAMAVGAELGMRPVIAHCHLGLGKLYRRSAKGAKASEHVTAATTMYREMAMHFWLQQAEAEMKKSM